MWGSTARHGRLGLFHDSDFAGDLEDSNIDLGEVYVASDVERCFPQLAVQEANISTAQFYRI